MGYNMIQLPWKQLGIIDKSTAAADAALSVAERKWSFVKTLDVDAANVVSYREIPPYLDQVLFRFRGKTNGDNGVIDVWSGRLCGGLDCDLRRIATLDVETGTQVSWDGATNYTLFADEITVTNATSQAPIANAASLQSGNDTELCAILNIPPAGCDLLVFHGHTAGFANSVAIDTAGYMTH